MLDFGVACHLIIGLLLLAGVTCSVVPKKLAGVANRTFTPDMFAPLRPLLILFVVAGHCDTMTGNSNWILRALHMGTPAVAMFFFVSGYGLLASYENRGMEYLESFYRRSAVKLLVPMAIAIAVYQIVYCFWGDGAFSPRSWTLIRQGYLDSLLPHCWFVFAIAFLYVIFALIYGCVPSRYAVLVVLVVVLAYIFVFRYLIRTPFCWWLTPFAFVCGLAYRQFERRIVNWVVRYSWKSYFLLAVLYFGVVVISCQRGVVGSAALICALSLSGPFVAIVVLTLPVRCKWHWLLLLSGVSYEIYLVHGIPKELLARCQLSPLVYFGLVYVSSVALAFGLNKVSMPIKNRLLLKEGLL